MSLSNLDITCSFDVEVKELSSVSVKDGYVKDFLTIEGEYIPYDLLNLTLVYHFEDGTSLEEKYEAYNSLVVGDEPGLDIECEDYIYIGGDDYEFTILINLYDEYEVTEFTYENALDSYTYLVSSVKSALANINSGLKGYVLTDKTGSRKLNYNLFYGTGIYEEDYDGLLDEFGQVVDNVQVGTYTIATTIGQKQVSYDLILVDPINDGYLLDSYRISSTTPIRTNYYTKEDVDLYSDILDIVIEAVYKLDEQSIVVIYPAQSLGIDGDIDEILETAGKKTVKIIDEMDYADENDDIELLQVEFNVEDFPFEIGEYLSKSNYLGYYSIYSDAFKVEVVDNVRHYYSYTYINNNEKGWKEYELVEVQKYEYEGQPYYTVQFEDDDYNSFNIVISNEMYIDGSYKLIKKNEADKKVTLNLMLISNPYAFSTYAINGKIDKSLVSYFTTIGEIHLGSKTGEIINADYTFLEDTQLYLVYQQDATGESFLGNYYPSTQGAIIVAIKADGIYSYTSETNLNNNDYEGIIEYRYKKDGGKVVITMNTFGESSTSTFTIEDGTFQITTGESTTTTYTKQA